MTSTLTPSQYQLYTRLRLLLRIGIVIGGGAFVLSMLFPTITQSFDFDNPGASKNTIVEPRAPDNTSLTTGKVSSGSTLIANTSLLGDFSAATLRFTIEDDSDFPEIVKATLKRSYRAMLFPIGEPIDTLESANILRVDNTYYVLKEGVLYPFVSEAAYRSRFGSDQLVKDVSRDILSLYGVATVPIGFRIGSLLSFADGVFVVTSSTEIRPVGSAEIFLALGYRFEDVKPVSEEELSLYKRGRIILLNTPHADGTVFRDVDTDQVFILENRTRRIVTDPLYRAFLENEQQPITTRSSDAGEAVNCALATGIFPRTYRCTVLLDPLKDNLGFDYELMLSESDRAFEIETLTIAFDTHVTLDNARTLLAKVKQRILVRFGLAQ